MFHQHKIRESKTGISKQTFFFFYGRQTDVKKPLLVRETRVSRKGSTPLFLIPYVNWILLSDWILIVICIIEYLSIFIIVCKMWSTLQREVSISVNVSKKGKRFFQRECFQSSAYKCLQEQVKGDSPWLGPQTVRRNVLEKKKWFEIGMCV